MSININELTLGQMKEIEDILPQSASVSPVSEISAPVIVGKAYLFRTVTHIEVGRVRSVCGNFITLEQASWIADTGRYHDCLVGGTFSEVEPYPDTTTINAPSLINYAPWDHKLPTSQK